MLKHHRIQGVLCAALAATGLLLTSCSHDPVEPAPVSLRGVNRAMNSTTPIVAAPLAAPRSTTASPPRAAESAHARNGMPIEHASGGVATKVKRSADAQRAHRHHAAPQMAGAVNGKAKSRRAAKTAVSATALARSNRESIPLDDPTWAEPAPVEGSQQQLRRPAL